jgi:hypothetical protein
MTDAQPASSPPAIDAAAIDAALSAKFQAIAGNEAAIRRLARRVAARDEGELFVWRTMPAPGQPKEEYDIAPLSLDALKTNPGYQALVQRLEAEGLTVADLTNIDPVEADGPAQKVYLILLRMIKGENMPLSRSNTRLTVVSKTAEAVDAAPAPVA